MHESDWKQLRKIIPEVEGRYLKEKNERIVELLTSAEGNEADKFWKAFNYMKKETKILRDCLGDLRRSQFYIIITVMYNYGMLRDDEIRLFSETVQRHISRLHERND